MQNTFRDRENVTKIENIFIRQNNSQAQEIINFDFKELGNLVTVSAAILAGKAKVLEIREFV